MIKRSVEIWIGAVVDAYMRLSATMDLHVTQVVDGIKGTHATLPKALFQK